MTPPDDRVLIPTVNGQGVWSIGTNSEGAVLLSMETPHGIYDAYLPPDMWADIVAAVSKGGSNPANVESALWFHRNSRVESDGS